MQKESIENPETADELDVLFQDEEEMRRCLSKCCYGDLYVIGRIWIEALKTALVGAKFSLIPAVHAAKPPPTPERPPPMKYSDLPMYTTPHYDYKDYVQESKKYPYANVKLMQTYLYPKVRTYRKNIKTSLCELKKDLAEMKNDICAACCKRQKEFVNHMRHPDNMNQRTAFVAVSTLTGFCLGKTIPRRLFYSSLGSLSAGALCFPEETDSAFREAMYHSGKVALIVYNTLRGTNMSLRERVPCREELPPPPVKNQKSYFCFTKK